MGFYPSRGNDGQQSPPGKRPQRATQANDQQRVAELDDLAALRAEEDYDDDGEPIACDHRRQQITAAEVVTLLDKIEHHRNQLNGYNSILRVWLQNSNELATAWAKFATNGGVSGADFQNFMRGTYRRRPHPLPKRGLLRLLVSRDPSPVGRRRVSYGDNDAA